jgi:hypothetical protein
MIDRRRFIASAACSLAIHAIARGQSEPQRENAILIRDVRLFDGIDRQPLLEALIIDRRR